jgi:GNAT superfamily N-acetyltransferase
MIRVRLPPETVHTLRDGRTIRIRPITPADVQRLREFHDRLSIDTTRLRFFTPLRHLTLTFAQHLCNVDFDRRCAFVVSFPQDDEIHGVGRYEAELPTSAEVAFVIEDALQGLGIGTMLLERLAQQARDRGFTRLTAVVLYENHSMLTVFRHSPYHAEVHTQREQAFVKLDIQADNENG